MITIIFLLQLSYDKYIWLQTHVEYDKNIIAKVLDEGINDLCFSYALDRFDYDFFLYEVNEDEMTLYPFNSASLPNILIYTNNYFDESTPVYHHPLLEELFESHQKSLGEMFENLNLIN